jgi:hypothetical protein
MLQRIESALIGAGIPDLYIRTREKEYWIELKNMPRNSVKNAGWTVPWRKGQQAWAFKYRRMAKQCTYTIVAFSDGFAIIPMSKHYEHNFVAAEDAIRVTELNDINTVMSLGKL